jgi:hypothetical protein
MRVLNIGDCERFPIKLHKKLKRATTLEKPNKPAFFITFVLLFIFLFLYTQVLLLPFQLVSHQYQIYPLMTLSME